MNLYNTRHLSNIKFSLTTSHGLPLSDVLVDEKPLNINFTMVLKVDIVEKNAPNERHTGYSGRPPRNKSEIFWSNSNRRRADKRLLNK